MLGDKHDPSGRRRATDRRGFLASAATAASVLTCHRVGAQTMSSPPIKNVVLVHGAWVDGSSWQAVIPLLQSSGMRVTAVQNRLTSLADDVAVTQRALALQDGPAVLVGHSYGGVVITEVGVDTKATRLVYVAALAPDVGEEFETFAKQFPTPPGNAYVRVKDGFALLDEAGVLECFAQDLAPERARTLAALQGPIAATLFADKTSVAAWRSKPSWYAVSQQDRMIAPELERLVAMRMKATTIELATSHASPLTRPREIADLILQAARA